MSKALFGLNSQWRSNSRFSRFNEPGPRPLGAPDDNGNKLPLSSGSPTVIMWDKSHVQQLRRPVLCSGRTTSVEHATTQL